MGAGYDLWIGPYARCSARTSPRKRTVNTCSDLECRLRRKGDSAGEEAKFCPKCGSPAEKVVFEVPGQVVADVHPGELAEGTEGTSAAIRHFNAEYGDASAPLFAPNRCNDALPRPMNIDAKYDKPTGEILQMNGVDRDGECTWFRSEFRDALELLRETYGKDNVEIRWGVLGKVQ
jgi:hypothetical protein